MVYHVLAELLSQGVVGSLGPPASPIAKAGRTFQRHMLEEVQGLVASPSDNVREEASRCGARPFSSPSLPHDPQTAPPPP